MLAIYFFIFLSLLLHFTAFPIYLYSLSSDILLSLLRRSSRRYDAALVIILRATIGFYTQLHHRIKDLFKSHQERESIFQANDRATEMILPRNDSLKGTHHLTRPRKAVCAQTL